MTWSSQHQPHTHADIAGFTGHVVRVKVGDAIKVFHEKRYVRLKLRGINMTKRVRRSVAGEENSHPSWYFVIWVKGVFKARTATARQEGEVILDDGRVAITREFTHDV